MSRGGIFDVRALAKTINRRRKDHNRLHPDQPIRITSAMSRILENNEEYEPYRARSRGRRQRPVTNPTLRTIVEIAHALDTTVGDLLDEPAPPISPTDRRRILDFAAYLTSLFRG